MALFFGAPTWLAARVGPAIRRSRDILWRISLPWQPGGLLQPSRDFCWVAATRTSQAPGTAGPRMFVPFLALEALDESRCRPRAGGTLAPTRPSGRLMPSGSHESPLIGLDGGAAPHCCVHLCDLIAVLFVSPSPWSKLVAENGTDARWLAA